MQVYSVMLEGIDASMGYFMNVEVAAINPSSAANWLSNTLERLD